MFEACIDGKLAEKHLEFEDNAAVCVVLASDGYPVSYEKGYPITGFEKFHADEGYYCFHAGTKRNEKGIVTNGGRVLGVTAKGTTLKEAKAMPAKEHLDQIAILTTNICVMISAKPLMKHNI